MTIPVVKRDVREISLALIDPPEIPMRDSFDDAADKELDASIRANGIQVPLIVERRGDRFRVSAGHRRYRSATRVGAVTVPCDVREPGELDAEAIKVLENDDREAVNAADAAYYLHRLFTERCREDVDQVCAITKRSRRYVEDRLLLFAGDEHVFTALKDGLINFSVAKELNQITDANYREMHLDQAMKYGMTGAAARDARKNANFATSGKASPEQLAGAAPNASSTPVDVGRVCYICNRSDSPESFRYVLVHEFCDKAIGVRVLQPFREEPAAAGPADA